jgi:hypothetical protein
MKENIENNIEVLVGQRDELRAIFRRFNLEDHMDFGQWGKNLLMEITGSEPNRSLHVTKRPEDLRRVNDLIASLKAAALTYPVFESQFIVPINLAAWSTEPEDMLHLDVPDGPHEKDCEKMFQTVSDTKHTICNMAVYGLTQNLIDRAKVFLNQSSNVLKNIDIVDARHYAPPFHDPMLNFVRANWMEWNPSEGAKYDLIVADDVLCNLSYWQTPLFFERVARALNRGGLFMFRTTARFAPGLQDPEFEDVLDYVRQFDHRDAGRTSPLSLEMLSPGVLYEMAWPTLHTSRFYDRTSRSLSLGAWNDVVGRESKISIDLKNRMTFSRRLRLTSMEYQDLRGMFMPHFYVVQKEMEAYSRWENDPRLLSHPSGKEIARRFHDYYRLVLLAKS